MRRKAAEIIETGAWLEFAKRYKEMVGEDPGTWLPIPGRDSDVERLAKMILKYFQARACEERAYLRLPNEQRDGYSKVH
jgi:hypothetical protein